MDLLIDAYGTFIGSTGERIVLRIPNGYGKKRTKKEYPIRRLEKIVVLRPASISTHAVKLALEHEVDIVYLGSFGKPIGRMFSSEPKGIATLRRMQLEVSSSPKAFELSKLFVSGKAKNQISYLTYLGMKYGKDVSVEKAQAEGVLQALQYMHGDKKDCEKLLGIEGYAAERYFYGLRKFYRFNGRKPEGRDKFNSAFNYGYGILYNEMERACLYVGLDPYLGLYHTERYGKPSLVLDLVEEFRVPVVDSAVFPLFLDKKLTKAGMFEQVGKNEYQLSTKGKSVLVEAVLKRLNEVVLWKGKRRTVKAALEEQVRSLARYFHGEEPSYTPFDFTTLL